MSEIVSPPFWIPRSVLEDVERLGALLNVGNEVAGLVHATITHDLTGQSMNTSDFKLAAYVLLVKGLKTFRAVQVLCRCGFGADALALCGSLFENVVDLAYMAKAPVRRPNATCNLSRSGSITSCRRSSSKGGFHEGDEKAWKATLVTSNRRRESF